MTDRSQFVTVAEVRRYVRDRIIDRLGGQGWQESERPYDHFGLTESADMFHQAFAVGTPETTYTPPDMQYQRQVLDEGVHASTLVMVAFAWNVAAEDQLRSVDEGTDAEGEVIKAVMAEDVERRLHVKLGAPPTRRAVGDDNYLVPEIAFIVYHQVALR